jgi:hypothetical protein
MGRKLYLNANLFLLLKFNSRQMISLKTKKNSQKHFEKSLRKQPNSLLPRRKAAGKSLMVERKDDERGSEFEVKSGLHTKDIIETPLVDLISCEQRAELDPAASYPL